MPVARVEVQPDAGEPEDGQERRVVGAEDHPRPDDALYARQRSLPDGPERLALLHEATRLLVAYMPYKFVANPIQLDLSQPWVRGYRRHPFTTRTWAYVDIDREARLAQRS